ncbi:MAG: 4-hydroxythreonine-4-phosphate dehydrogenase PdxA [Xanthobacteraceae bacterium]
MSRTGEHARPAIGRRPLAVTIGEPAGIGPDVTLLAWHERTRLKLSPFYVIGDPDLLARRAKRLGLDIPVVAVAPENAAEAFGHALPVVGLELPSSAEAGQPDRTSAPLAIASIQRAVTDVMAGRCTAIVTNPVAKSVLYGAGFTDPGHTEFLAKLAREAGHAPVQPVMMLWSDELAVVPVTVHLSLKDAISRLSADLIVSTARTAAQALATQFGVARPRLVVAGLNPHAGENGALGNEESTIIVPAIHQLTESGLDVRGPLSADTMFHAEARATYDVALCMYHDQALIPIKTLAFDRAVNVTLGLPFVRTSPDHGTAFDIAGTGRANPASFVAAVALAARLSNAVPAAAA